MMEIEKTEVYNPESPTCATDAPEQTEDNGTPVRIDNGAGVGGKLQSVVQIHGIRPQQPLEPAVTTPTLDGGAPNMIVQLQEMQNALQQQMELFSRMIVAQSENLALYHQKQGSTQLLERTPARNVQDDTDGSEELEYLTPITSPRFKRVHMKLGYMEAHRLPGSRKKDCQKEWC